MIKIKDININDYFTNPKLNSKGALFKVIDVNIEYKLILIQSYISISSDKMEKVGKPFWKIYPDRIFTKEWFIKNE